MQIQTPGATSKAVWRRLEDYTLQLYSENDNSGTYVTVCDVAGRGILVSVGWAGEDDAQLKITVKITIDGGTAVEKQLSRIGGTPAGVTQGCPTLFAGFASSCKVEMKMAGAGSDVKYWASVLEE
jgi:hypothetical protein